MLFNVKWAVRRLRSCVRPAKVGPQIGWPLRASIAILMALFGLAAGYPATAKLVDPADANMPGVPIQSPRRLRPGWYNFVWGRAYIGTIIDAGGNARRLEHEE